MSYSYFYGLCPDGSIVGGDCALIEGKNDIDRLFKKFEDKQCVVGFTATHWECGATHGIRYHWYGDQSLKDELFAKLKEHFK